MRNIVIAVVLIFCVLVEGQNNNDRDINDRDINDRDLNDRNSNDRNSNDRNLNDRNSNDRNLNDRNLNSDRILNDRTAEERRVDNENTRRLYQSVEDVIEFAVNSAYVQNVLIRGEGDIKTAFRRRKYDGILNERLYPRLLNEQLANNELTPIERLFFGYFFNSVSQDFPKTAFKFQSVFGVNGFSLIANEPLPDQAVRYLTSLSEIKNNTPTKAWLKLGADLYVTKRISEFVRSHPAYRPNVFADIFGQGSANYSLAFEAFDHMIGRRLSTASDANYALLRDWFRYFVALSAEYNVYYKVDRSIIRILESAVEDLIRQYLQSPVVQRLYVFGALNDNTRDFARRRHHWDDQVAHALYCRIIPKMADNTALTQLERSYYPLYSKQQMAVWDQIDANFTSTIGEYRYTRTELLPESMIQYLNLFESEITGDPLKQLMLLYGLPYMYFRTAQLLASRFDYRPNPFATTLGYALVDHNKFLTPLRLLLKARDEANILRDGSTNLVKDRVLADNFRKIMSLVLSYGVN